MEVEILKKADVRIWTTDRGMPLVFWDRRMDQRQETVLTVENYGKWYGLYLIEPNNEVKEVKFDKLQEYCGKQSPYLDHAPNPTAVKKWCEAEGWYLDPQAEEMMIGRWEQEYKGHY